jgi:hypothetical protein
LLRHNWMPVCLATSWAANNHSARYLLAYYMYRISLKACCCCCCYRSIDSQEIQPPPNITCIQKTPGNIKRVRDNLPLYFLNGRSFFN